MDEPVQVRLVLDANLVQRELRWRLRSRKNEKARSALHEAIDSGTLIAFAPTALIREIDKHIPDIAQYAKVSEEKARNEWGKLRQLIHFHEPGFGTAPAEYVDPDDAPYKQVCIELGANAVYSKDSHFKSMDVPLLMLDLDQIFREYARANSIKLAFHIGSAFTLTISVGVLKELLKLCGRGIERVPVPLKIGFLVGIGGLLIHPRSRIKIIEACRQLWGKLNNPQFRAVLGSVALQVAEAHQSAKAASKKIEEALPKAAKRSALVHAREICVVEKVPLPLAVIETRMRAAGYVSRSKNFRIYLSRILRCNQGFFETSPGMWTLRALIGVYGLAIGPHQHGGGNNANDFAPPSRRKAEIWR